MFVAVLRYLNQYTWTTSMADINNSGIWRACSCPFCTCVIPQTHSSIILETSASDLKWWKLSPCMKAFTIWPVSCNLEISSLIWDQVYLNTNTHSTYMSILNKYMTRFSLSISKWKSFGNPVTTWTKPSAEQDASANWRSVSTKHPDDSCAARASEVCKNKKAQVCPEFAKQVSHKFITP